VNTFRRPPRGFTLIELMVALGISVVVIAGSLLLLNALRRTFQGGAVDRALQESGRVALTEVIGNLRLAGYGIDPGMAFDFGQATSPQVQAPLPQGVAGVQFGGYQGKTNCTTPVTCRDHADAPDEIVFHYRDPSFGHLVTATATSSLMIRGPLRQPLEKGQILQVICYGGDQVWAYVTVDARVDQTDTPGDVRVTLSAGGLAADLSPVFPTQNSLLANTCYTTGTVRVFAINRFRYFIQTYDAGGGPQPWGTAGARPYLMLDQGLDDGAGGIKLSMVAPDVEDLQFAYVYSLSAPGNQLRGATEGVQLANQADDIDLAPASTPSIPTYATPSRDAARTTGHPSNIRAVRVGVVVRQAEADTTVFEPILPRLGNRAALVREANRRRAAFETTVPLPNLDSRAPVFPTVGDPALLTDANLNFGGG
jgi:type IV pilus assembly protein PilW